MGTNSLPILLAHIKHTDSSIRQKLYYLARQQQFLKLPFYGK